VEPTPVFRFAAMPWSTDYDRAGNLLSRSVVVMVSDKDGWRRAGVLSFRPAEFAEFWDALDAGAVSRISAA